MAVFSEVTSNPARDKCAMQIYADAVQIEALMDIKGMMTDSVCAQKIIIQVYPRSAWQLEVSA